jgi:hypothetical protein
VKHSVHEPPEAFVITQFGERLEPSYQFGWGLPLEYRLGGLINGPHCVTYGTDIGSPGGRVSNELPEVALFHDQNPVFRPDRICIL